MKQPALEELKAAIETDDPLNLVNAFMATPIDPEVIDLEVERLPKYWEHRVCAMAELLVEVVGKLKQDKVAAVACAGRRRQLLARILRYHPTSPLHPSRDFAEERLWDAAQAAAAETRDDDTDELVAVIREAVEKQVAERTPTTADGETVQINSRYLTDLNGRKQQVTVMAITEDRHGYRCSCNTGQMTITRQPKHLRATPTVETDK